MTEVAGAGHEAMHPTSAMRVSIWRPLLRRVMTRGPIHCRLTPTILLTGILVIALNLLAGCDEGDEAGQQGSEVTPVEVVAARVEPVRETVEGIGTLENRRTGCMSACS